MPEPIRRTLDLDLIQKADDALERARRMPAGPERIEALKTAGILRHAADAYGLIFAPKGRPKNRSAS